MSSSKYVGAGRSLQDQTCRGCHYIGESPTLCNRNFNKERRRHLADKLKFYFIVFYSILICLIYFYKTRHFRHFDNLFYREGREEEEI